MLNAKLKKYVSWKPDPDAETFDAFTVDWHEYLIYASPFPFYYKFKGIYIFRKYCHQYFIGICKVQEYILHLDLIDEWKDPSIQLGV